MVCEDCGSHIEGDRQVSVYALQEVWRDAWDNDIGSIRPRPITDSAIKTAREDNPNKLIVHFMQPHHPFLSAPYLDSGSYIAEGDEYRKKQSRTIWEKLEDGEVNEQVVQSEYKHNLRTVLEDVELLLNNIDSERAIITTDHGNALGEHGIYGHQGNFPIDCLVEVPWYETSAQDERSHIPSDGMEHKDTNSIDSEQIKSRLSDLGYL
jgi:hypothetical protein